jgi:hypothetical protein
MRLERDADDNRTALITPSNARFLGMLVSRLTFIQQRSYYFAFVPGAEAAVSTSTFVVSGTALMDRRFATVFRAAPARNNAYLFCD